MLKCKDSVAGILNQRLISEQYQSLCLKTKLMKFIIIVNK